MQYVISMLTSVAGSVIQFYRGMDISFGSVSINVFDAFLLMIIAEAIWFHFNGGSDE